MCPMCLCVPQKNNVLRRNNERRKVESLWKIKGIFQKNCRKWGIGFAHS